MRKIVNKAISSYKNLSLPFKVSLWYFICLICQKGLAFLTTPIFTRIMPTGDYGVVSLYNSWAEILIIFTTMGLANSVFNVGLTRYEEDKDHFQSSMIGLELVYFAIAATIFLSVYSFFEVYIQLDLKYIYVMLSYCLSSTLLGMWILRMRMDFNYKKMVIITLANTVFGVAFSVVFALVWEDKPFGKIVGSTVTMCAFGLLFVVESIRKNHKIVSKKYWKFALLYNIPMIPHFLSTVILNQLDRIMIQNMVGVSEAGIYSVAYNSAAVVYVINNALSASYNPWLLQRLKARNYSRIKELVSSILLLYLGILVIIILFAPEILRFMAPTDYYEGIYIIPPVACSMFFILLFNVFAPVEHFSLKTKFLGLASTISATSNVILNCVFIKIYGYLAAGYTTLACYIVFAISHWFYMKKCCKEMGNIYIFEDKHILIMSIIVCIISILSAALYQFTFPRYMFILAILGIVIFRRKNILNILKEIRNK